jgi:FixH
MQKSKFHWGHGILVALGLFMIFILSLIYIFTKHQNNSELVAENYYEEELRYQDVIDAKKNSAQLSNPPTLIQNQTALGVQFPAEYSNENTKFKYHLFRTDDQLLDLKDAFQLNAAHNFQIPATLLKTGSYTLKIQWESQSKKYQIDYNILWK